MTISTVTISLKIPDSILTELALDQETFAQDMKLVIAIAYFQQHRLSLGKASELAGISRLEFMDILADRGITIFDYDESEIALELDVINHLI